MHPGGQEQRVVQLPIDAAPPVVITALPAPSVAETSDEVYGPIDTEAHFQAVRNEKDCPQSTEDEIVVCAEVHNDKYRIVPTPPRPTVSQSLGEALNVKIGNLEIGSIDKGDGTRAFGLRLKF